MKLLIVLSVIACGYAAKLDRTYLPPANAGQSGGSPGFLNTPLGPSGFGQPAGFGQPGANGFNGGKTSGSNGFGAPSNQYGQPGPSSQSGQTVGPNFDAGFGAPAQNFENQAQDYQRSQPQRAQASADQNAEILRSDSQNDGETFSYSFETSNGISAEESGVATNGVQAQGAFAYSDDDGQMFRVQYTADQNGYQPQGDHLPTPHPIPEDILKSIEENARAAAAGTQEGAYNPDEDTVEVSAPQYNSNAPTSYNQAPTGQNGLNKSGKSPAQLYAAPNSGYRPQGGSPSFSQGPSQQYNAESAGSSRPSNGFSQQSPSQLYGSPSNGAGARPNGFGQGPSQYSAGSGPGSNGARPNSFGQGPSQQYSGSNSGASNIATSGSNSGPSNFAKPSQYQAPSSGQFPSAGRPQESIQAQDASGYQYNKPQGGFGGNNNGPQQYRPQNSVPSGSQGFSRPSGNNAFPSSGPSSQGSFGASPNSQGSYGYASGSNSQGSFAPSGPNGPSGSNGPAGPKGPFGSGSGSPARPNANFGPSGSGSQPSSSNGFGRPQGSNGQGFRPQGQTPNAKSPMPDSGYEYNRPSGGTQFGGSPNANSPFARQPQNANSPFGGQPQNGFKSDQGRPDQTFGAPRAPPSFSEEQGYKY